MKGKIMTREEEKRLRKVVMRDSNIMGIILFGTIAVGIILILVFG